MPHAIIRGKNGRRHEVDFGDAPIRVEIYASDETVEIFVEADFETHAEERRRFAILNIPRNLFSEASGAAARRSSTSSLKKRASVMGVWGRRLSIYRTKQAKTPRPRRRTPTLNRLGQICMSGTAEPCCPEEETPVGGNAGVSEADDHRFGGICDRPAEANAYARPPVPALCSESE